MQRHGDDEIEVPVENGESNEAGAPVVAGPAGGSPEDDVALERSPFPHPPWTVGLVLVAGVITLAFGILVSPVWLVVGSPFLIVLVLWLWIRLVVRPDDGD